MPAKLEHLNICVHAPDEVAEALCALFGWRIRWRGSVMDGGLSVHVGGEDDYIALYAPTHDMDQRPESYRHWGMLNHVGVTVDDLDAVEARVREAGFTPREHADYEPGRRFYFMGPGGIDYEVVSYA
ncbi:VOC family protein [Aestuariicoccus sp. MJ-SS9]|uniref:VOC family protein n=1 Tax=Aestuariicoccus sp. MJ-SS9 TaxID=3079855 RepID=UPI0029098945|nr:VOC family protein [Aestuariicoccus sp. MJ-SS9]MDU8911051.1 VOC family protein [Aestuariicoccus sp. MJ-SS9]